MAARHVHNKILKKFLDKKIGHRNWLAYNELHIPAQFGDTSETLTEDFFHGVAVSQFTMIQRGGTFINPMLYAMNMDFKTWNHILHNEPDFRQHIRYIDVPYEIYAQAVTESAPVKEEDYALVSESLIKMVDKIKDDFYVNSHLVH
jgi:hypothetical protein